MTSIELTDGQIGGVVADYASNLTDGQALALFQQVSAANRHTIDHVSLALRYARWVEKFCNLPQGTVK